MFMSSQRFFWRRFFSCASSCFTQLATLRRLAFLLSHCFTASSMALLRSPFLPPNTVTTASLSLRSVSSERTIYILPKGNQYPFETSMHITVWKYRQNANTGNPRKALESVLYVPCAELIYHTRLKTTMGIVS